METYIDSRIIADLHLRVDGPTCVSIINIVFKGQPYWNLFAISSTYMKGGLDVLMLYP